MHLLLLFVPEFMNVPICCNVSDCNRVINMFIIIMVMVLHKGL